MITTATGGPTGRQAVRAFHRVEREGARACIRQMLDRGAAELMKYRTCGHGWIMGWWHRGAHLHDVEQRRRSPGARQPVEGDGLLVTETGCLHPSVEWLLAGHAGCHHRRGPPDRRRQLVRRTVLGGCILDPR